MKNVNIVLEGEYKGNNIFRKNSKGCLAHDGMGCDFDKANISSYVIIDETNKDKYSFWKGALGVALFGGIGAVAGIKGKNKKEYIIAIEWKDGDKSLICIDEEYYKVFVKSMF